MRRKRPSSPYFGPRTLKNFGFLYSLYNTKSAKKRYEILQNATREQLLAVMDVCSNITKGHFTPTPRYQRVLERYIDHMRRLNRVRSEKGALRVIQSGEGIVVDPTARRKRDRIRVMQTGRGFLPALLVPVLFEIAHRVGSHLLR